jgi:hypothetical protein
MATLATPSLRSIPLHAGMEADCAAWTFAAAVTFLALVTCFKGRVDSNSGTEAQKAACAPDAAAGGKSAV